MHTCMLQDTPYDAYRIHDHASIPGKYMILNKNWDKVTSSSRTHTCTPQAGGVPKYLNVSGHARTTAAAAPKRLAQILCNARSTAEMDRRVPRNRLKELTYLMASAAIQSPPDHCI